MEASLLYKLHSSGLKPGVVADPALFKEVHSSKYGLVRIWKVLGVDMESRKWGMDPKNRNCDAPGSWYCPGAYPPALPDKPPSSHRNLKYEEH
jgi:dolichyl-diphosphooligosaccharide--protein glycosyltransferase